MVLRKFKFLTEPPELLMGYQERLDAGQVELAVAYIREIVGKYISDSTGVDRYSTILLHYLEDGDYKSFSPNSHSAFTREDTANERVQRVIRFL